MHGSGFIISQETAASLGFGRLEGLEQHIRPYLNGRDLTGRSRDMMVIDLFGLSSDEVLRRFPEVYQWVRDRVKPVREGNVSQTSDSREYAERWWLFGKVRTELRSAVKGLSRYIATVETAKHRVFVFLDASVLPDNKLINFAFADAYFLGVLSSSVHVVWALAAGGKLGPTPVYVKTACFDTFPFPVCSEGQKETIRDIAERLDAHRKRQQELDPDLTLTEMYNVLETVRAGKELTEKERRIYDAGLVGILRVLHDALDAAVFDAYGWPTELTEEDILSSVVALNAQRLSEEREGSVRWLRPEFQAPNELAVQAALAGIVSGEGPAPTRRKQPWPSTLQEQVRAVKDALRATPLQSAQQVAATFKPASRTRVSEILDTLTALGQTRRVEDRYTL